MSLRPVVEPGQPRRRHHGLGAAHVKRHLVEPGDRLEVRDVLGDDGMERPEHLLEALHHTRPVHGFHRRPRPAPHGWHPLGHPGQRRGRGDEAAAVAGRHQEPGHAVLDVHVSSGVVVGDNCETARHRLERHVAKRLRLAREQEDVGRGVVGGELVAGAEASEHQIGVRAGEAPAERPVADHHEAQRGVRSLHRAIRRDGQLDVLLGCQASHVQDDQIALARAPFGAECRGSTGRIEALVVDPAPEHAEALEARRRELGAKPLGRDERAGGRIVEPAEVGGDRTLEPARAIVTHVPIEVRVKAAVDADTQRGAGAHRGPSERPLRRDVHGVRTPATPCGAQRGAGGKAELEPFVAGQPHAGHEQGSRLGPPARHVVCRLAGSNERDGVVARPHPAREPPERRRDAVDLRRVRLGHDAHVARHDHHCRGRYAQNSR
jgi:hypothetical protein